MDAKDIKVGQRWRRKSVSAFPAIIGSMDKDGVRVDDQRNGIYSWITEEELLKHWEPVDGQA
jgi:hypothetical protein